MKSFLKSLSLAAALCVPVILAGCGDDKTAENAKPIVDKPGVGQGKDKPAADKPVVPPVTTPAAEPVKPAEAAKPPGDKPEEAAKPAEAVKPAEVVKPAEPAKPAEAAKPADPKS